MKFLILGLIAFVFLFISQTAFVQNADAQTSCGQKNMFGNTIIYSEINVESFPSSVYSGDMVSFIGTLSDYSDCPLANQKVHLVLPSDLTKNNLVISKYDTILATTTTDKNGIFKIGWESEYVVGKLFHTMYLVFEGEDNMKPANKMIRIEVNRYNSDITLNQIPKSINVGEPIIFSGKLFLDETNMEGLVVYIKDEDSFDADDLLATAYVNSDGSYSITWIAEKVDPDGIADIYAVFEATGRNYRVTTCDDNITYDFGGACKNTLSLRTMGTFIEPEPIYRFLDPKYKFNGDEYVKLYYSLPFNKNPVVAIVPQPESYDHVKKYFIPIQEGIKTWNSGLGETGGDWDVDFDIIQVGERFPQRPDVIINVVAYDDDMDCGSTRGLAWVSGEKPLNSKVCATSFGKPSDPASVSATAGHEFVHTMGLGHAFNKKGDVMCSVENGKPTCPSSYLGKSKTPSNFDFSAIKTLYGEDGWKNPNYDISRGTQFTVNNFNSGQNFDDVPTVDESDSYEDNLIKKLTAYQYNDGIMVFGETDICHNNFGSTVDLKISNPFGKLITVEKLSLTNYCSFKEIISLNTNELVSGQWTITITYFDSKKESRFMMTSLDAIDNQPILSDKFTTFANWKNKSVQVNSNTLIQLEGSMWGNTKWDGRWEFIKYQIVKFYNNGIYIGFDETDSQGNFELLTNLRDGDNQFSVKYLGSNEWHGSTTLGPVISVMKNQPIENQIELNPTPEPYVGFERGPSQRDSINEQLQIYDKNQKIIESKIIQLKSEKISGDSFNELKNMIESMDDSETVSELSELLMERGHSTQSYKDLVKSNQKLETILRNIDDLENQILKSSTNITSKTHVETTKFLSDLDGDGVPDKDDKCPKVFGDKDKMGCKTSTSISEKEISSDLEKNISNEVIVLQKEAYEKLNSLKNEIKTTREYLEKLSSNSEAQKEKINQAWTLLKDSQSNLDGMERRIKGGDSHVGYENYETAKDFFDNERLVGLVDDNLKGISQLSDKIKPQKIEQPQTCFLIWCW
ncbi:MAG: hypothetical protein HOK63_00400 [Thaumarchaeota archaeon]|nr:hypothetical protein [Nitrososphaerota archaeon]